MSAYPHNPLRLAHVIHSDGPGGGPVVVCQLLAGLKNDFDQMVFCGGEGRLTAFCRIHDFACKKVKMDCIWRWPWAVLELAHHFRKAKPDMVILHGQWAGPLGALAAKLARVKHSVYIAHCPAFYHSTNLFRVVRNYLAEKIPCSVCTRVVSLSEGNYYNYLFRGWMPESHLVHIANGVDTASIPAPAESFRCEHGFDPAARHCVYVGRLDDQKRPDWLMEAWAQARHENASSAWILWVVGDGVERPVCEMLAEKLEVAESVRFVGSQPEGLPWINAADVVVMTSLYEGHALVPLEAMACSRAVAAFSTDGITDSVQHGKTGFLCEIGDVSTLGQSIAWLLQNDAEREAFGRNGRRFVEEKFPLSKTIESYRSLLHGLLAAKPNDQKSAPSAH